MPREYPVIGLILKYWSIEVMTAARMHEPSCRWDVKAATGFKADQLRNNLGSHAEPLRALRYADEHFIEGSDGSGLHFYFPLTRMKYMGEFFKGAFTVMAPQARVTLLKTPLHEVIYSNRENLRRNLEACQRPEDERHIVIDNSISGTTVSAIQSELGKKVEFADSRDFHAGFLEQMSHLDKLEDGSMVLGSGFLLDYLLKYPDTDFQEVFRCAAYILTDKFLRHPKKYFTQDELTELLQVDGKPIRSPYDLPHPGRTEKFLDFIKNLSDERCQQIIGKLNREDAKLSRAMFMLGKAYAKEYLESRAELAASNPSGRVSY